MAIMSTSRAGKTKIGDRKATSNNHDMFVLWKGIRQKWNGHSMGIELSKDKNEIVNTLV